MLPRRARNGPKEPHRHVGVEIIAAVSVVRHLRADQNATAGVGPGQWLLSTDRELERSVLHRSSTAEGPAVAVHATV